MFDHVTCLYRRIILSYRLGVKRVNLFAFSDFNKCVWRVFFLKCALREQRYNYRMNKLCFYNILSVECKSDSTYIYFYMKWQKNQTFIAGYTKTWNYNTSTSIFCKYEILLIFGGVKANFEMQCHKWGNQWVFDTILFLYKSSVYLHYIVINYRKKGYLKKCSLLRFLLNNTDYFSIMSAQLKFVMPPPRKRGRPSKVSQHPELVPTIETFIKNNNPMAQERRRDDIMYTNGASLELV